MATDRKRRWSVVVGNVGIVLADATEAAARRRYESYVLISKRGGSRASGEPVTLMRDSKDFGAEIIEEYIPPEQKPHIIVFGNIADGFRFIGEFNDRQTALDYGVSMFQGQLYVVVPMEKPK